MARASTSSVLHPDVALVLFDALGAAGFLQEKLFPGMYVCPDKLQKILKRPSVRVYLDARPSKLRKVIHQIAWALKERALWRKLAHGYSEDGERSFAGGLHTQVLEPWTKCASECSECCRHESHATQSVVVCPHSLRTPASAWHCWYDEHMVKTQPPVPLTALRVLRTCLFCFHIVGI